MADETEYTVTLTLRTPLRSAAVLARSRVEQLAAEEIERADITGVQVEMDTISGQFAESLAEKTAQQVVDELELRNVGLEPAPNITVHVAGEAKDSIPELVKELQARIGTSARRNGIV